MGESNRQQAATSSRLGLRNAGGEIVEVQGGHIVRSTGRKDRHSKVCTAKGPRDRRVRLSAHTAIQFYDVQDRLGYDRPSKAVDWLIKKAKAAIDELAELPAWSPTTATTTTTAKNRTIRSNQQAHSISEAAREFQFPMETLPTCKTTDAMMRNEVQRAIHNNASFLPPSLDSDAITDTIKSFFPMGAAAGASSPSIQFQSYPPDLLSRTSSQSQDLRLSLQSLQEPILLQHHGHGHGHAQNEQQMLFSGAGAHHHHNLGFDGPGMVAWSSAGAAAAAAVDTGGGGTNDSGGFVFSPPLQQPVMPQPLLQPFFGQNQFFSSQRGPLQSSNTPSIRAWIDPAITADHHHHQISQIHQHSAFSGIGFTAPHCGGFSGFRVPARIQGEEEEHDGIHSKPSSASSDSRH